MRKHILTFAALALAGTATAQNNSTGSDSGQVDSRRGDKSMAAMSMPMGPVGGSMTEAEVGMPPMTNLSAPQYVMMAADSDMYEMTSSKFVLGRTKNPEVRRYAQEMIRHHTMTTAELKKAVKQSRSPKPPTKLSADSEALLAQLRTSGQGASLDNTYLTQQAASHQKAWAVHKGYYTAGTDQPLKMVAGKAVPIVEQHLREVRQIQASMPATGM